MREIVVYIKQEGKAWRWGIDAKLYRGISWTLRGFLTKRGAKDSARRAFDGQRIKWRDA